MCVGEYDEQFESEDMGTGAKDFMSVLDKRKRHIISERFFTGKKMGEIASEMRVTYYQTRWIYRQAPEKM